MWGGLRELRVQWTWRFWGCPRVNKFHWFTDEEIAGLQEDTPAKLDAAREYAGVPFRLTSTTGGQHAPNSAHYKGLAVDIGLGHLEEGVERDKHRFLIVKGLILAGFERIEVCPLHVHADRGQAPEYVTPWMMLGKDS